jgi:hypothetical protein
MRSDTMPEETPTRPRQSPTAEAVESFAFLAPVSVIIGFYYGRWDPSAPDHITSAVSTAVALGGSYALSRIRDWRYRRQS